MVSGPETAVPPRYPGVAGIVTLTVVAGYPTALVTPGRWWALASSALVTFVASIVTARSATW